MQETIKKVKAAESEASRILTDAGSRAAEIINKKNSETAEKLNIFRASELKRLNKAVKEAEEKKQHVVDELKGSDISSGSDIDSIADQVLRRVITTIFDKP